MASKKNNKNTDIIDIKSIINLIVNNWVIFSLCVLISLILAFFINKFSPNIYEVNTSIVVNEENSNRLAGVSSQIMNDFGFISSDKNFANELVILKSTPVVYNAIENLNFRISYFEKQNQFLDKELYKSSPFVIIPNYDHPQIVQCDIRINIISDDACNVIIDGKEVQVYSFVSNQTIETLSELKINAKAPLNKSIKTKNFDFKILLNKNQDISELVNRDFYFQINTDNNLVKKYHSKTQVKQSDDFESTIAILSLHSSAPEKAIDYLNSLTSAYLQKDISQKKYTAEKTIDYINTQLNKISGSLSAAENELQRFRSSKQIVDISMQSEQIFQELNQLKNEKARFTVNLKYVNYIQDYFSKNMQYSDLITPSAMGIEDATMNNLVEELIRLNAEKVSFIENNQDKSPYLQKINIRIDNLRNMISENINYVKKTTLIAIEDIDSRIQQLNNQIEKMPATQRQLMGIERVFDINNNIYTYLLQKKSEAEIAKSSYQSEIKILEPADVEGLVSPDKKMNYIIALTLGLFFPFVAIKARGYLSKTILTTNEIYNYTDYPIIGKIYSKDKKTENVVDGYPDSHIAESFRLVRVNLNYFLNGAESNIIAITSTISGEGKSFISINLANILANNNFKTVLVGFDIRKPKTYSSLNASTNIGITDFLSYQANVDDIILKTPKENLDLIMAGTKPPNPAELINSKKTDELLNFLKDNYQYVILDTAPIGLVTDTYKLMENASLKVFVTRINHTPKKELNQLIQELENKNLVNCVIINGVPIKGKNKYGYGYYET